MIRINVAPEIRVPSDNSPLVRAAIVVVVSVGLVYLLPQYVADSVTEQATAVRAQTEQKKAELQKLRLDVAKAKMLQSRLADMQLRTNGIRSLNQGRKQVVLILDKLQQQHLERMWFDTLNLENKKMTLTGLALDHTVVSEYVQRIKLMSTDDTQEYVDTKNFNPELSDRADKMLKKSEENIFVTPLKVTEVVLKKSASEDAPGIIGLTLQKFDMDFEVNVP